jgi:hypothetical protein
MRREMIEALSYPRLLIEKFIEANDCPYENLFDATSERCHACDLGQPCHWVQCLDEFSDFSETPTYTINASLRYAVRLVESLHSELQHDETRCTCEVCTWVRNTQRLIEEYEEHLAPDPFVEARLEERPPH